MESDHQIAGFFWITLLIISFVLTLLLRLANSHEGTNEKSEMYRALKDNEGFSCCSVSDCRPTSAWIEDGHWKARIEGTTEIINVPDDKVLKNIASPEGIQAVICVLYHNGEPRVRCFVRPGET